MSIGIIYGSDGGATEEIATKIKEELGLEADLIDISNATEETFNKYDKMIIGTSTWGEGELQEDWEDNLDTFKAMSLKGKTIAFFGLGDQESYDDTFANGIGILYDIAKSNGANIVGDKWPTDEYDFSESEAVKDDGFVGLVIDEDNQSDLSASRITQWVEGIKNSFA